MKEKLFTTSISEDLHQKLKIKAAKEGKTLKEITTELFTKYVEEKTKK